MNLLFCLSFIIVRYIYVFHAKNITAIQDEFWICFLNIWTSGFCVIAYFAVGFLKDKQLREYYFCIGRIAKKSLSDKSFIDFIFLTFFVLILFALLFVGIMYKIRDYNIRKKNFTLKPSSFQVGYYFSEIQKSNLATFAEGVITLIVICITGVIPVYVIENSSWSYLSTYPGYLWVYVYHLYQPEIVNSIVLAVMFSKNLQLRNYVKRRFNEKFEILQHLLLSIFKFFFKYK